MSAVVLLFFDSINALKATKILKFNNLRTQSQDVLDGVMS
jgi:hypothetical protein